MIEILEKLANEIPTIAVAVWAVLNLVGIDVSAEQQEAWITTATSLIGLAIWFLVRRNTDGPVTAYKQHKTEE